MKKLLSNIGRIFLRTIALTVFLILSVLWVLLSIPVAILTLFIGTLNWIILGNIDFTLNIVVFWFSDLREDIISDIFEKIAYCY